MSEKANQVLSWISSTGTEQSLILVEDTDKSQNDVDRLRIELCSLDTEENQWETKEKIDYVDEITDFGIPETLID
mgnify:FL=1